MTGVGGFSWASALARAVWGIRTSARKRIGPQKFGAFLAFITGAISAAAGTREIYVWQRQPSAELETSLRAFASQADGFCALAAEVTWKNERPTVVRPALDFQLLASLQRPLGLALRIGNFSGAFG